VFCEAGVDTTGGVDVGSEHRIALGDIGCLDESGDGVVSVLGHSNELLVRMHFETKADERLWVQSLGAVIGSNSARDHAAGTAVEASGDVSGEMHMLQARSRQLQNQIGTLEALNDRRDKQLNKMVKRLDGAMQMLSAVQDMVSQQRCVIQSQKLAIAELSNDLGLSMGDLGAAGAASPTVASPGAMEDSTGGTDQDADVSPSSLAADTDKMNALLEQADKMQQLLEMLESKGAALGEDDSPGAGVPGNLLDPSLMANIAALLGGGGLPGMSGAQNDEEDEEDDDEDEQDEEGDGGDGDESEEAVRERLRGLEAEKERFAGLLRSSQQEHEDLLERLNGMRSLMAMLGLQDDLGEVDVNN
jgi:hypothetical protein